MLEALRRGDGPAAEELMREHLEGARDALVRGFDA